MSQVSVSHVTAAGVHLVQSNTLKLTGTGTSRLHYVCTVVATDKS